MQLGNAVCPPVVHAVAKRLLIALAAGDPPPSTAESGGVGHGTMARDDGKPGSGDCGGERCDERCEAFLSAAAINLLRGVTPPRDAPAAAKDYGRYGAEEPAERYERVLHRPVDELFCMECASMYRLSAADDRLRDGAAKS